MNQNSMSDTSVFAETSAARWNGILCGQNVIVDDLHGFNAGLDKFKRSIPGALRNRVSDTMDIRFKWNKSILWKDLCKIIDTPSLIFQVKAKEWSGNIAFICRSEAVYYFIESLLGGKDGENAGMKIEKLQFTNFEKSIVSSILDVIITTLKGAFYKVCDTSFVKGECESEPAYLSAWNGDERVSWLQINMHDGEMGGVMDLVFPHAALHGDGMKRPANSHATDESSKHSAKMEKIIEDVEVVLRIEMNNVSMTIDEIDNLNIGDTILMNRTENDKADLVVNNFLIAKVDLGQVNGNLAGHIVDV